MTLVKTNFGLNSYHHGHCIMSFKFHFLVEAASYCPLVQVTFHSSPLIFTCPYPILNHFYLISALLRTFYRNTASKFLKFTITIWVISSLWWRPLINIIIPLHCFTNADWLKRSQSMLDSVLLFLTNIPHVTNVGLTENPTFLTLLMLH